MAAGMYLFGQQVASELKLHPTDYQCINVLDQAGPLMAGAVAEHLGLTSGATTAVVDRLKALGYVRRRPAKNDRRCIMIELNEGKIKAMRARFEPISAHIATSLEQFSDEELEAIAHFLRITVAMPISGKSEERFV